MQSERINPFINRQPLEPGGRGPFMRRLRRALGHDVDQTPMPAQGPPARDEALVRQCGPGDSGLVQRWIGRAQGNSMMVQQVGATAAEIHAALDVCFAPHTIGRAILNMGNAEDLGGRFGIAQYLAGRKVETVKWGTPGCREAAFTCDAAITDCRAGLADAGSLLVWTEAGEEGGFGRSSTLVVPVHVVLLPASRILPDMVDGLALARRENPGQLPSNIVVINGPSKTADIEMNLITGVHGPKFLHVIVIGD